MILDNSGSICLIKSTTNIGYCDYLALQTGNFDAIKDENKREAAKAVKARPSIENFGKLVNLLHDF